MRNIIESDKFSGTGQRKWNEMSYSGMVKSELLRNMEYSEEEFLSLLAAVMKVSGTMSISSGMKLKFRIITENAATARFLFRNAKEKLGIELKVYISRGVTLKKRNSYIISFDEMKDTREFLIKCGILAKTEDGIVLDASVPYRFRQDENVKRAYLAGTFLGSGTVSDPEKQYHMEFVTRSPEYAEDLKDLLSGWDIKAGIIERKGSQVVYIKDGEGIADVLTVIGTHTALLEFENTRVMKDMRNRINRIVNCETANLSKTVNASVRQVESIKQISEEYGLQRLPENLREIAEKRLQYPDLSLKELGEMLDPPVGKSGVNHRLRKIEKIAGELSKGDD